MYPKVTQDFIEAVASSAPDGNNGLVSNGVTVYPCVDESTGTWRLDRSGLFIDRSVASALASSTANADGSYTTADNNTYVLVPFEGWVLPDTPPPPPPPR